MIDRVDAVVHAVVGMPFEVRPTAAPSTGSGWEIATLPSALELLGSDVEPASDGGASDSATGDGATGDGATDGPVFRLLARHPGRYDLRFVLKRRWEQEPIDIQIIEVEASAPA